MLPRAEERAGSPFADTYGPESRDAAYPDPSPAAAMKSRNVSRRAGRPAKRFLRNGEGLKSSAGIELPTVDAGCLLYDMGLDLPPEQHAAAKQHAKKRWLMTKALGRAVPAGSTLRRPPKHHAQLDRWIAASYCATNARKAARVERPLVLARTVCPPSGPSAEAMVLIRLWAAYWASGRVRTSFFDDRGFGLVAAEKLAAGNVLARGLIEADYSEKNYAIEEGGTMYGPAARVNAACSKRCANAKFTQCDGTWTVWARRAIAAGEEVIAFYPATGRCVCGRVFDSLPE